MHTYTFVFHDTHKPPVAVAIVKENHGISFRRIGLPLHRCNERMEGINEFEIDVLYIL